MAHIRKPLAAAAALNAAIFLGEAIAGARANSASLLMDAVHNFSDQLALVCLFLAYVLPVRASTPLQRAANALNGLGLIVLSAFVGWHALSSLLHPQPVVGSIAIAVGLFGVAGNALVARLLKPWAAHSAAIRLAYVHNLGDAYVSIAPVLGGALVVATSRPIFDSLAALGIGSWLIVTTIRALREISGELIWPEDAVCPHAEHRSR